MLRVLQVCSVWMVLGILVGVKLFPDFLLEAPILSSMWSWCLVVRSWWLRVLVRCSELRVRNLVVLLVIRCVPPARRRLTVIYRRLRLVRVVVPLWSLRGPPLLNWIQFVVWVVWMVLGGRAPSIGSSLIVSGLCLVWV